jgi:hypothetical protein
MADALPLSYAPVKRVAGERFELSRSRVMGPMSYLLTTLLFEAADPLCVSLGFRRTGPEDSAAGSRFTFHHPSSTAKSAGHLTTTGAADPTKGHSEELRGGHRGGEIRTAGLHIGRQGVDGGLISRKGGNLGGEAVDEGDGAGDDLILGGDGGLKRGDVGHNFVLVFDDVEQEIAITVVKEVGEVHG